jgi:hypothetical protein
MKKLFITVLFCFFGATLFAQGIMYITNNSPYKVRMQIQALPNSGILTTTLTNTSYITIPAFTGVGLAPQYTFTNFNNTAPATLTSQFTQWTRKIGTVSANLTKLNTQNLYGPIPTWNLIKFDVIDNLTNVVKGSGGIARVASGYYPVNWPCTGTCTNPGSPLTSGTFSAGWTPLGTIVSINFTGTL